jgi:hypothetical protein
MAIYRLCVLDGAGHVVDRYEPDCASDEEAYVRAEGLADGRAVDIWQSARWIAFLDGADPLRIALQHHEVAAH